jgi:hypothetical protein
MIYTNVITENVAINLSFERSRNREIGVISPQLRIHIIAIRAYPVGMLIFQDEQS